MWLRRCDCFRYSLRSSVFIGLSSSSTPTVVFRRYLHTGLLSICCRLFVFFANFYIKSSKTCRVFKVIMWRKPCRRMELRHSLTVDAVHSLLRALILSRLDYCNGLLAIYQPHDSIAWNLFSGQRASGTTHASATSSSTCLCCHARLVTLS